VFVRYCSLTVGLKVCYRNHDLCAFVNIDGDQINYVFVSFFVTRDW